MVPSTVVGVCVCGGGDARRAAAGGPTVIGRERRVVLHHWRTLMTDGTPSDDFRGIPEDTGVNFSN